MSEEEILWPCGDCAAEIGELHKPGCDVERCPRCGHQAISCYCVYEVSGMDPDTLEEDHPDIFKKGPTDEMCTRFDKEWAHRRIPWTGHWPGTQEAREYGIGLDGLSHYCRWDPDLQRWVKRPTPKLL